MYLLDTNVCIGLLNGTSERLTERLRATPPSEVRFSSIVKAELLYGARHSAHVADNLRLLRRSFAAVPSVPFDDACAEEYGIIRSELSRAGRPIGPNDLLIAATARAHDLNLVTSSLREFSGIPALEVEDWGA